MYTFLDKKNQLSIEHFFSKCVGCTPLINIFGLKSRILTQQNSQFFFSYTGFAHFVWTFLQWHPINAQNSQTEDFSVLFQLKDLISENMKISEQNCLCKNEHGDLLFLLACWIQH